MTDNNENNHITVLRFVERLGGSHERIVDTLLAIVLSSLLILVLKHPTIRRIIGSNIAKWKLSAVLLFLKKRSSKNDDKDVDIKKPEVSGLFVYPVKSLRAVSVPQSQLDSLGLQYDRRFMIVRANPPSPFDGTTTSSVATHRFITQRQYPCLATISVTLPNSNDIITLSSHLVPNDTVAIDVSDQAFWMKKGNAHAKWYKAGIWDDIVDVVDVGDEAASFVQRVISASEESTAVSNVINKHNDGKNPTNKEEKTDKELVLQPTPLSNNELRVVSIPTNTIRKADDRYIPPVALSTLGQPPNVALTDGFPILIACERSLQELNQRLQSKGQQRPIQMNRFRPNIVVKNTTVPFEEDTWKTIVIGENVILHVVKGCPRCKQSCTDQNTGERFEDSLVTLAEFRALGSNNDQDVYFAQNAVLHPSSIGRTIRVGDPVRVVTTGEPVWDIGSVRAE